MVFQDPMTSLNPLKTVGKQIQEALELHQNLHGRAARERTIEILSDVGITEPERRYKQYPHEFSGGMRQRAVIATAIACNPNILICDEPTTALDVTIQAQIIELLEQLQKKIPPDDNIYHARPWRGCKGCGQNSRYVRRRYNRNRPLQRNIL